MADVLDAQALIEKHRARGVLVDSNLLILFLVGTVNPRRIATFKRTAGSFTEGDFDLLVRLIEWFGKLIATPHVLTQLSDLADMGGGELYLAREVLARLVDEIEEVYNPGRKVVADSLFKRLGLADAAIATVCVGRSVLVLTADLELQLALERRGFDALNFNHVRQLRGRL